MEKKKRKKRIPWLAKMLLAGALFGVCFALGCAIPTIMGWNGLDGFNSADIKAGEPVNILLMGIDARPGEENARSDTMILACIDPELNKVALISIPRDTKIDYPQGADKINAVNQNDGPEAACRTVEELLDTNVDYYVLANFNGFKNMVDILGGVDIEVEERMYKPSEGINLRPGLQHLDGKGALAYVRYRGDALGDISRTERQQKFIMAFAKELVQTNTILKLPALIPELKENVKTNMGMSQMLALANLARNFKAENLIAQTLPGYFYDDPKTGISYWVVDENKTAGIIEDLFDGRKVAVVEESPIAPAYEKPAQKTPTEPVQPKKNYDYYEPPVPVNPDPVIENPEEEPWPGEDIPVTPPDVEEWNGYNGADNSLIPNQITG